MNPTAIGAFPYVTGLNHLGRATTFTAESMTPVPAHHPVRIGEQRALRVRQETSELPEPFERVSGVEAELTDWIFDMRKVHGEIRGAVVLSEQNRRLVVFETLWRQEQNLRTLSGDDEVLGAPYRQHPRRRTTPGLRHSRTIGANP